MLRNGNVAVIGRQAIILSEGVVPYS